MKKIGGIAITLPLALAFTIGELKAQAAFPAPLTPASSGQLQCYKPNLERKTCKSISSYRYGPNGTINSFTSLLIAGDPLIIMEGVSPVEIKSNMVCGRTDPADIDAAAFTIEGRPATSTQTALLRERLKIALKPTLDHKLCIGVSPDSNSKTFATLDDGPYPGTTEPMIWISPADRFRVGQ